MLKMSSFKIEISKKFQNIRNIRDIPKLQYFDVKDLKRIKSQSFNFIML